jgi:uncharacterized protein (DUF1778 family)
MPRTRLDDIIQIRTSSETKALIARAADLRHQKLSEFMLDSARRKAEETILETSLFSLDAERHEQFVALLDAPPEPAPDVLARYRRKKPWR